jgi:tRNA dimethylallyltransferase
LPEADQIVRAALDAEIAQHGIQHLHRQLALVDAETAARLAPNDTQRIQRALEIYRLSGQAMSTLLKQKLHSELPYRILSIALIPGERSVLHQRIATRFKQMLEQGLIEELRSLRQRYQLHPGLPSMRCVGYRQAWQFLEGKINEAQLLETGIAATRQLAKRQHTWLRSMPDNIEMDCLLKNLNEKVSDTIAQLLHV